jgi:hypothetical protein
MENDLKKNGHPKTWGSKGHPKTWVQGDTQNIRLNPQNIGFYGGGGEGGRDKWKINFIQCIEI